MAYVILDAPTGSAAGDAAMIAAAYAALPASGGTIVGLSGAAYQPNEVDIATANKPAVLTSSGSAPVGATFGGTGAALLSITPDDCAIENWTLTAPTADGALPAIYAVGADRLRLEAVTVVGGVQAGVQLDRCKYVSLIDLDLSGAKNLAGFGVELWLFRGCSFGTIRRLTVHDCETIALAIDAGTTGTPDPESGVGWDIDDFTLRDTNSATANGAIVLESARGNLLRHGTIVRAGLSEAAIRFSKDQGTATVGTADFNVLEDIEIDNPYLVLAAFEGAKHNTIRRLSLTNGGNRHGGATNQMFSFLGDATVSTQQCLRNAIEGLYVEQAATVPYAYLMSIAGVPGGEVQNNAVTRRIGPMPATLINRGGTLTYVPITGTQMNQAAA